MRKLSERSRPAEKKNARGLRKSASKKDLQSKRPDRRRKKSALLVKERSNRST